MVSCRFFRQSTVLLVHCSLEPLCLGIGFETNSWESLALSGVGPELSHHWDKKKKDGEVNFP